MPSIFKPKNLVPSQALPRGSWRSRTWTTAAVCAASAAPCSARSSGSCWSWVGGRRNRRWQSCGEPKVEPESTGRWVLGVICIYIYMYEVYIYIDMHVCMYIYIYIHMYIYIYTCTCTCTYIHIHIHIHIYIYIYIDIDIYIDSGFKWGWWIMWWDLGL